MSISKKARYGLTEKLLQADFLNDREKDVLRLRIGLEGNEPCTLEEIGERYKITRERVRQIGVAVVRKAKKNLPEEKNIAGKLFIKAWEPKYLAKERRLIRRRAVIKRNRTIVRNRCKKLGALIEEFANTREGKERIAKLFKEMRIKFRRNKSLFEPDVVLLMKDLRRRWSEVRKKPQINTDLQGQIF